MYYIYLLQNKINNKIYVGFTKNLKRRMYEHFWHAKKLTHSNKKWYIHNSINKYGKDNFSITEWEIFDNIEDALEAEQFWISFFRSWDRNFGYNLTRGGEGTPGVKLSKKHKEKISKSLIGNQRAKGAIHTQEWKDQMSTKHSGENNGKVKITKQDVLDIRQFHSKNIENNELDVFKYLSDKYGLSISGLEKIIYRKTWKHIQ